MSRMVGTGIAAVVGMVLCGATGVSARPFIAVDTVEYNHGVVNEGEVMVIEFPFVIRNTGTSPLMITDVRAGCGCTVVDYDTLIPPKGSGTLLQKLDLHGLTGVVRRGVTVLSNASNEPALRLTMVVTVEPVVGVDTRYIQLGEQSVTLELTSRKSDLQVREVLFEHAAGGGSGGGGVWQQNLPEPLRFGFAPRAQKRDDGLSVYTLVLHRDKGREANAQGVFVITTNHPRKEEIRMRGFIERDR